MVPSNPDSPHAGEPLLLFGCGYLGSRIGDAWLVAGGSVRAVTRSASKAAQLQSRGIEPFVADIASDTSSGRDLPEPHVLPPLTLPPAIWAGVRSLVFAVGYDRGSSQPITKVYAGGLARVVAACPETIERVLYISSTGVYGSCSGETVDETTPANPTREGGKACLAAEDVLRNSPLADRGLILRLAGIYGPGRIPRARELLAGEPIPAPSDGWLNLIHVEDAAQIVLLALRHATPPQTYVVSDGQPVQRGDYYGELARLLNAPPPRFSSPAADSPAAQRAGSDKRIDPSRMLRDLQPQLRYPSYQEGLAAIVGTKS